MGDRKSSGPVLCSRCTDDHWFADLRGGAGFARTGFTAVTSKLSDWEALAALTDRLDELRGRLDMAEANNQIAAIYALEEAIVEAEAERERLFSRLQDRLADEAAA
jgi:hypothetical protein